jgi:hypothetical protein
MQDFQNHQAQGGWVPVWLQKMPFGGPKLQFNAKKYPLTCMVCL